MEVKYLLDIGLILLATKLLGLLTKRIQMPQVVGALLAGLLLGPVCLGWIGQSDFIAHIAEIGVIVLIFCAGMETNVQELKKCGGASMVIAVMGVLFPLAFGWWLASFLHPGSNPLSTLQNIFVGIVLTATSVSISVETLKELGKLTTKSGNAILSAALMDGILGIIALSVLACFIDSGFSPSRTSMKLFNFFLFCGIIFFLFHKLFTPWLNRNKKDLRRFPILAFAFCLLMAYISEEFFGTLDITGAFVAGIILSNNRHTTYMQTRFDALSFMFLSPVFFASIGLQVSANPLHSTAFVSLLLLVLVAIFSKILGCGLGAKFCRYTNLQAAKIGVGMVSRGEIALIVAVKGASIGLVPPTFFAPIIVMVIATAILAPTMLKLIYKYQSSHQSEPMIQSALVERYEERRYLEDMTQEALRQHEDLKEQLQRKKQ